MKRFFGWVVSSLVVGFILLNLVVPPFVFARIGVGVGNGKVQIDDQLKPGVIYELPPMTVLNTGDEESDYEVAISYHEQQPELRPPEDWFIFSPQSFHLTPGQAQIVTVKLNLPVRIEPGNYFAYVEGHPTKKAVSGNTSIGVAAATKLYFTVIPGNFFEGIYYKIVSFWKVYAPWPQRFVVAAGILLTVILFKKFFHFEIGLKKPIKDTARKLVSDKDE